MKLTFTLLGLAMSISSFALPKLDARSIQIGNSYKQHPLQGADFEGIVALNNCSGSIVRFTTSLQTDKAMVLTNGHCFEGGMPKPGVTHLNLASSRSFGILSKDGQKVIGKVSAEMLLIATMTRTDMSLYRLTKTYQEIENEFKTKALTLLDKRPSEGTKIEILSGYWKRAYHCSIEYFVDTLKEAGWTMKDSIRYLQPGCETIGGTSGSPIINSDTREIVGVNNTGNENGERCTMNNPCEVDKNGTVKAQKGSSYGQQTYIIYTCLQNGKINLDKSGCMIPKSKSSEGPKPTPNGGW